MKFSIKVKSSLFLAGLLIMTVSVLSLLVLGGIRQNQQIQYEELLARQSKLANLFVQQEYLTEAEKDREKFLILDGQSLAVNLGAISGLPVILYDLAGKEVGNSLQTGAKIDVGEALDFALKGKVAYLEVEDSLYYLAPLRIADRQIGVIQFHYSLKNYLAFYNNIKRLFWVTGSLTFLLSFIAGYLYFNRLAEGILILKKAVEQIKMGHYRDFPNLQRTDELGELSQGIDYMAEQIEKNISAMQGEETKLRLAIDKLQRLEQQQKQFIGNITHEFKTPLTAIKAYADLMEMYRDDPKLIEEAISNIGKETKRLSEMVEKTLYLAALEKYDFEFRGQEVEVKALLQDICGRLKGKIYKFGLELDTDLEEAVIWADKESLIQVFMNLLDNAIKYNEPKGLITICSYTEEKKVNIEIRDTGIGIPVEVRQKIYEPFYTVNKDRSRKFGGTGLGLALVKKLVEQQGGAITLKDEEKKGTTFVVSFPLYLKNFTSLKH